MAGEKKYSGYGYHGGAKMIDGKTTYKAIAEALPYEIQSALLSVRDDEPAQLANMPTLIYTALYELMLIEGDGENMRLSRLGEHLVNYCSC